MFYMQTNSKAGDFTGQPAQAQDSSIFQSAVRLAHYQSPTPP